MIPFYMWNSTDGLYSNVFYGASFVDYVGHVDTKLTMIRPVNGENYDSFIYGQYFDVAIDGAQAPDKNTLKTIAAIRAIPERVTYENRAVVETARALYNKIPTLEQQALVTNYADLVSAEQRIVSLTPTEEPAETPTETPEEPKGNGKGWLIALIVLVCLIFAAAFGGAAYVVIKAKKEDRSMKKVALELLQQIKEISCKVWKFVVLWAKKIWAKTVELAKKVWPVILAFLKKLWPMIVALAKKVAALCVKGFQAVKAFGKKLLTKKEKTQAEETEEVTEEATEEEVAEETTEEAFTQDQTQE